MGIKNLFILFFTLLICCSPNTPKTPDKAIPVVVVPFESAITKSTDQVNSSMDAAQSVIDAIQKSPVNVEWHDLDLTKITDAALSGQFVLIYCYSDYCAACDKTKKEIYNNEEIADIINEHFYAVRVKIEEHPEYAPLYVDEKTGLLITPTVLFVMPNGVAIKVLGYVTLDEFRLIIKKLVGLKEGWISVKR